MKVKTRLAAFLLALFISLVAFNTIVSYCCDGLVDLFGMGKSAGYEIVAEVISVEPVLVGDLLN
jgi:hypothetical protein